MWNVVTTSPVWPARRGGRARAWPLAAGLLLAGGCAAGSFESPSDVEPTSRVYEGSRPEAVFEQTVAAVRRSPLRVVEVDEDRGRIVADLADIRGQGWAECSRPLIVAEGNDERGNRLVHVTPEDQRVELTATVREVPGGVRVTLDPVFDQQLPGSLAVRASEGECRSTGRLERRIFEAV